MRNRRFPVACTFITLLAAVGGVRAEKQGSPHGAPVLPVGVYVNGGKHLQGQSAAEMNAYVQAMARNIRSNHFNTVVLGEPFGPEQIAIFGQHGLSVLVQAPTKELLDLNPVIGGILGEDPRIGDIADLMERHEALSAGTEKPLMICVNGALAGTKSPRTPMKTWDVIWESLRGNASKLEEIEPHVRRYWHYAPIEHGPPYPILQSYVYKGCLSFSDSLQQAASGLGQLGMIVREEEAEAEQEESGDGKAAADGDTKEKKKAEPATIWEFFGQVPLWVKLQSSGTPRAQSDYRPPTPAQLQTMMHLSLAHGAKGVMLDCYQADEPGWSGMVDPLTLQPTDGRLAAAGEVARLVEKHAALLGAARTAGAVRYSNPFAAPIRISTGRKEDDNLTSYLYVINLNTRAPISTWLYDLPRTLRDIDTGEELSTEVYETRGESWWGLFMTLQPGEARILEYIDLLPTVHQ